MKDAFHCFGIVDFSSHLHGLSVDGASVNLGTHKGVVTLLKDESPWLTAVHCFNHRIELTVKDAFENTFFEEIKLYHLYQKISKRLHALQESGRALREKIPKPIKATGTRWIAYHYDAMKVILKYCGAYMTHLEELANNHIVQE